MGPAIALIPLCFQGIPTSTARTLPFSSQLLLILINISHWCDWQPALVALLAEFHSLHLSSWALQCGSCKLGSASACPLEVSVGTLPCLPMGHVGLVHSALSVLPGGYWFAHINCLSLEEFYQIMSLRKMVHFILLVERV